MPLFHFSVCMRACVRACMCVSAYVCVYMCTCMCLNVLTYIETCGCQRLMWRCLSWSLLYLIIFNTGSLTGPWTFHFELDRLANDPYGSTSLFHQAHGLQACIAMPSFHGGTGIRTQVLIFAQCVTVYFTHRTTSPGYSHIFSFFFPLKIGSHSIPGWPFIPVHYPSTARVLGMNHHTLS